MREPSMTPRELSWAAGLFEGEGTIRINCATARNLGHLICSVVNTDREVVEYFQSRWPAYMKPATGLDPTRQRPSWVRLAPANKAETAEPKPGLNFLRDIGPYLVTRRVRHKAAVGLHFQRGKHRPQHIQRSDAYHQEQWEAFIYMRTLNSRGVRRVS
jgi:hypothetical protein